MYFIDWMTSSRGEECYIEAKSCRLPANSTARAADGLPSLDELNLITYDWRMGRREPQPSGSFFYREYYKPILNAHRPTGSQIN